MSSRTTLKVGLPDLNVQEPEALQGPHVFSTAHDQGVLIYRCPIDTVKPEQVKIVTSELGPDAWIPADQQVYYFGYIPADRAAAGQHPFLVIEQDAVAFVLGVQALMVAQELDLITYLAHVTAEDPASVSAAQQLLHQRQRSKAKARDGSWPETGGHHLVAVNAKPSRTLLLPDSAAGYAMLGMAAAAGHPGIGRLAYHPWTLQ